MTETLLSLPPLSLYIHIPWCLKKCPYCDFNSHALNEKTDGEIPETLYTEKLLADLALDSPFIQGRKLSSIFIGGGTPSLFSAAAIDHLLQAVEKTIPFDPDIEITLEANPGTFEQQKFSDYRLAGINRLSIGIQSFDAGFLKALGRVHDDREALGVADIARKAGFDNFNLDLMFGLPGQSPDQALQDLTTALDFEPAHLSWYQLTIEPNTVFYSKPPQLPQDDLISDMHSAGIDLLSGHGLTRYEISAFSQAGRQSVHNTNYWLFGDYIGIGAGAHGKITLPGDNRIIRTRKARQPGHYMEQTKHFAADTHTVSATELPMEFMMNALRLCAGTDADTFEIRTGLPVSNIEAQLHTLRKKGLLQDEGLATTDRGLLFLNDVLAEFLPEDSADHDKIPVNSL